MPSLCRKCKKELPDGAVYCCWCGIQQNPKRTSRKRGNGGGTAYKRGSTWTAQVTVGYDKTGETNRIIRRTKGGFRTKTDALAYCSRLYDEAQSTRCPSLDEYYQVYSSSEMEKLSDSKRTAYTIAYNKLNDIKYLPINTITIAQLQNLIREKCPTFYPARDMKSLLNHIYRLAAIDSNAKHDLPDLLTLPKLAETEADPFTENEQAKLWNLFESGDPNAAIPLIMIYTGMMPGEMRRLTAEMVDLDGKQIVGVGLKTRTRRKSSVILPDAILPVVEDTIRGVSGSLYPISENAFYNRYYSALSDAGITRHLTPYSCRHTTATALAIDNNVAPQTLKRIMRWSSTRMMDRYVHPDDSDARAAANTLKR